MLNKIKQIDHCLIELAIFIIKIVSLPIYLIGFLVPKNEKVWIFGSYHGVRDIDNSWHLFNFVTKNMPQIKAVWLTKEKTIIRKIRASGGCAYHFLSLRGIYYSMVAKVGIMCFRWSDLPFSFFLFSNRSCLIQLWHGTPLKSLNGLRGGHPIIRILRFMFVSYLGREYDYVISATESNEAIYSEN
jgi:CDP-glycerol glycerophosphotransferase